MPVELDEFTGGDPVSLMRVELSARRSRERLLRLVLWTETNAHALQAFIESHLI